MKKILLLMLIFSISLLANADSALEKSCSVHDGDTFTTCTGRHIRIFGVDAPELGQPLGKNARDYLSGLISDKNLELKCQGRSYQRAVCRVYVDRWDISARMVSGGYAYDSAKYSHGEYAGEEAGARLSHAGVWAQEGGGIRPWDYRASLKHKWP